jgi:hypothetical protein
MHLKIEKVDMEGVLTKSFGWAKNDVVSRRGEKPVHQEDDWLVGVTLVVAVTAVGDAVHGQHVAIRCDYFMRLDGIPVLCD